MKVKADLKSVKRELNKLTDVKYLKKEINRIANEIRKFDLHVTLTPQAKETLTQLETRFRDLLSALSELQKQVDSNVEKFVTLVRTTTKETEEKIRSSVGLGKKKATTKRATSKKTSAPKTPKKTTKKTASKAPRKTSKKAASK